jgi:hypothetical protein
LSHYQYPLQDTLPGDTIAEEWRHLVTEQARALDLMLRSLRINLDTVRSRTELATPQKVAQLEALAGTASKGLTALAQQLVVVEQKLARLVGHDPDANRLPPEQAALVQTLEQVINILHANLIAARQALLSMFQEPHGSDTPAAE